MRFSDPARLVRDTRGVLEDGERVKGQKTRRRREQCECLGKKVRRACETKKKVRRTSGRCLSTGSFVRMRAYNTSRIVDVDIGLSSRLI